MDEELRSKNTTPQLQPPMTYGRAFGTGAACAWLIGIPIAALVAFVLALPWGIATAFGFALFVLFFGFWFTMPGDIVLGGIVGCLGLTLARRMHKRKTLLAAMAACGALLGALNGAWLEPLFWWLRSWMTGFSLTLTAVGAGAGLLTGPIIGLKIRNELIDSKASKQIHKRCPFCHQTALPDQAICTHCYQDLLKNCSLCGRIIETRLNMCPDCRSLALAASNR